MIQRRPPRDSSYNEDEVPEVPQYKPTTTSNPQQGNEASNQNAATTQATVDTEVTVAEEYTDNPQIEWQKIDVPDRKTTFNDDSVGNAHQARDKRKMGEFNGPVGASKISNAREPFNASQPPIDTGNNKKTTEHENKTQKQGPPSPEAPNESDEQTGLKWEKQVAPPEKFLLGSGFMFLNDSIKREQSDNTQFLGELIVCGICTRLGQTLANINTSQTSNFLNRRLKTYDAHYHWTSALRKRAGFSTFKNDDERYSAFTLPKGSDDANEFFVHHGYSNAKRWRYDPPQYHLEVTTISRGTRSAFPLRIAQLERVSIRTRRLICPGCTWRRLT